MISILSYLSYFVSKRTTKLAEQIIFWKKLFFNFLKNRASNAFHVIDLT